MRNDAQRSEIVAENVAEVSIDRDDDSAMAAPRLARMQFRTNDPPPHIASRYCAEELPI